MSEQSQSGDAAESVEHALRRELAQGDTIIATAGPILRHLLVHDGQGLFGDEVLARIRGMMAHLASQLLQALAPQTPQKGAGDPEEWVNLRTDALGFALLDHPGLLAHAHALVLEDQACERLNRRSGIDPVLPPLVQELAADKDAGIAALAMQVLAAQARFVQQQRRMELPLGQLPEALFDAALSLFADHAGKEGRALAAADARLRAGYDAAARREALITRLLGAIQHRAGRALGADHAGIAIFVTALHLATGQTRETAILSLGENQIARLALGLRGAGLEPSAVEMQFGFIHPDITLPDGFERLSADRAAALLADARPIMAH